MQVMGTGGTTEGNPGLDILPLDADGVMRLFTSAELLGEQVVPGKKRK